jgi:hypothetical protein
MCLLALYYRTAEDAPLVVGAVREEVFQRGGEPPRHFEGPLRAVGGVDPAAGGTWLGINERGVLIAVTNRRKSQPPAAPPSRGMLVRELLHHCETAEAAAEWATQALEGNRYAGCNLLCADAGRAVVLQGGDWLRIRPLPPGLHLLTNGDVNDEADARLNLAAEYLAAQPGRFAENCVQALRRLTVQREPEGLPICFRRGDRGTVSGTILALRPALADGTYLHAQGPPDRTPYADYSHLLRELAHPPAGGVDERWSLGGHP